MRLLPSLLLLLLGLLLSALTLGIFAVLGGSGPLWLRSLGSVALGGPGPNGFVRGLLLLLLASAALALATLRRPMPRPVLDAAPPQG
ncbi:hypothetical protein ACINK0_00415 [Deinococcus sp. VB343]|uniref:Uncharacterized protein n=1 Tax=Deinococcus sp. VB142 TaxID=3112952 RepID=A0AAU6Q2C8_9DEIO|nr:hypothetical protein [Deinococcus sp.]MDO4247139.1 hypothetical protein [Deinococcus sp.]